MYKAVIINGQTHSKSQQRIITSRRAKYVCMRVCIYPSLSLFLNMYTKVGHIELDRLIKVLSYLKFMRWLYQHLLTWFQIIRDECELKERTLKRNCFYQSTTAYVFFCRRPIHATRFIIWQICSTKSGMLKSGMDRPVPFIHFHNHNASNNCNEACSIYAMEGNKYAM